MDRQRLFRDFQSRFFGLERVSRLADGSVRKRRYFDSGASCLMMQAAHQCLQEFLPHYANTHSRLYFAARVSTEMYDWAHRQVLSFLGLSEQTHVAIFIGSGSTAGLNRVATALRKARPERSLALLSLMEHHSNDLPHRLHAKGVIHVPCVGSGRDLGPVSLEALDALLTEHGDRVNYVAVTAASNVTGVVNSITEIARLVHAHRTLLVVDGSQAVAHQSQMDLGAAHVDALVFSGHKIYVPGAPGVLVVRRDLLASLEPQELGGGMVNEVYTDAYELNQALPQREEAGTPNIPGAISLGFALEALQRLGMDLIVEHEQQLLRLALEGLSAIPGVRLYGSRDLRAHPRLGIVSLNIAGMDHALLAAVLNDYFNISVRNDCFCAHPYVRSLLREDLWELELDELLLKRKQGMVRVSFGLYNTEEDVRALIESIRDVASRRDWFAAQYGARDTYVHDSFEPSSEDTFSPTDVMERWLQKNVGGAESGRQRESSV
jgi:cysteine desulfurase / selenocysteine lyase